MYYGMGKLPEIKHILSYLIITKENCRQHYIAVVYKLLAIHRLFTRFTLQDVQHCTRTRTYNLDNTC